MPRADYKLAAFQNGDQKLLRFLHFSGLFFFFFGGGTVNVPGKLKPFLEKSLLLYKPKRQHDEKGCEVRIAMQTI